MVQSIGKYLSLSVRRISSQIALFSQILVNTRSQRNPRRISPMNHWVKAVGIPPGAGLGLHPSGE